MIKIPSAPPRSQVVGILVGLVAFLGAFPVLFFNEQRVDPLILETASNAAIVVQLHTEYLVVTWVLRVFGFVLAWIGMMLLWLPLARMLKILPSLELTKTPALIFLTLPSALALATVIILLSMVLANVLLIIVIGILAPSILLAILRLNRPKQPAVQT